MRTKQEVKINFKHYGEIIVPKGTALTHNTACGIDESIHFVNEFGWLKKQYPNEYKLIIHDATYYGIDIPKEFVEYD